MNQFLNYVFHWFTFFVLVQMSSVFITYLFTHLCISFSWCMSLAKLPKSVRCRKKTWLRKTRRKMWQDTRWLVPLPRSCRHKIGDHMSTDEPLWYELPCLVEWWSSYSGWGWSLEKSLPSQVWKMLRRLVLHSSKELRLLLHLQVA